MYLIIGGDSTIGQTLSKYWEENSIQHIVTTRNFRSINESRLYLDLMDENLPDFTKHQFNAVIFCAACTSLDYCKTNPKISRQINVDATIKLASLFNKYNSHLIFLSSNQVFDGLKPFRKTCDLTCPVSEYGRQKVLAENYFRKISNTAVLRLTKVIHHNIPLLQHWETKLKADEFIEAFVNVYISPITLENVILNINDIVKFHKSGIFHLSGLKDISYYDFAKNYFEFIPNSKFLIKKTFFNGVENNINSNNFYSTLSM